MNKMRAVLISAVVITFAWTNFGLAQDIGQLTDDFYAGLADVLEKNMDDPQQCLKEAEQYYQENQATVEKIRAAAEGAFVQAEPMMQQTMDKYKSMSEEELKAMPEQQQGIQVPGPTQGTPGMDRYIKLIQAFTMKYPRCAVQLTMLSIQLIPESVQENLSQQEQRQDAR